METEYEYTKAVASDVKDFITENILGNDEYLGMERNTFFEKIADTTINEDSVTGNASGSYTFSTAKAHNYVFGCDNTELLADALEEYGLSDMCLKALREPEYADVLIRTYCLSDAITMAVDELIDEEKIIIENDVITKI